MESAVPDEKGEALSSNENGADEVPVASSGSRDAAVWQADEQLQEQAALLELVPVLVREPGTGRGGAEGRG